MRAISAVGLSILCLSLGACTLPFNPNSIEGFDTSDCETEECIINAVDNVDHSLGNGTRFKFMEGYPPQKLSQMKEEGRLEITEWNPVIWTAVHVAMGGLTFVPAMATFDWGVYGDMYECHAYYVKIPGWQYLLEHELWHCLGYRETGWYPPQVLFDDYSKAQKIIMEDEGVSRWIDTRFYREQVPRYYGPEFYFDVERK